MTKVKDILPEHILVPGEIVCSYYWEPKPDIRYTVVYVNTSPEDYAFACLKADSGALQIAQYNGHAWEGYMKRADAEKELNRIARNWGWTEVTIDENWNVIL